MECVEIEKLYNEAKDLFAEGDHIKALMILDDLLIVHREAKDSCFIHMQEEGQLLLTQAAKQEGEIFLELAEEEEDPDLRFAYLLGSVGCFSEVVSFPELSATVLQKLGEEMGSVLYYKKCLDIAKQGLSVTPTTTAFVALKSLHEEVLNRKKEYLENLIKEVELRIVISKTCPLEISEPIVSESKKSPEPSKDKFKGLRSFWVGLDVKIKREFMKVSIAKLLSFVEGVHQRKGRDALEQLLTSAREDRKWIFWMCRSNCSKKFCGDDECKNHLEKEHAADFKPSSEEDMVQRIGKKWASRISVGGWEPVDAVAAIEMIAAKKTFASKSKNGWSKELPLVVDAKRGKLLREIKLLLVSLCEDKILSCSIRDWVMHFPVNYLGKLDVSKQSLIDCHLMETPQSICFLECHELNQILDFLKSIKRKRHDGTDLVCNAVASFLGRTRVKEKIDFDSQFSFLLLDRRLLENNNVPFDDEGAINVFDQNVHYAKANAKGDKIISWLTNYNSGDKIFPKPIREHNLGIWIAVLKAVQFTCRTLRTKYSKKMQVLDYDAALTIIEDLCMRENKRRENLQEDQWNRYASLLCNRCEERVHGNSQSTKLLLCAVRDVLEGASQPTFDFPGLKDCINLIREHKNLSDDMVLKSTELLKSVVTQKVLLIDSKILLIDNSRIKLLANLSTLSVFDNRTYMFQLLKPFLLNEIVNMEYEAKSSAAKAYLLLEEEKEPQTKQKKSKRNKRTSMSKSSPLDKTVEPKPSANLEPENTSPSLQMVEEDSIQPQDTLSSERGQLEISSKTENQEEATEDMQNTPGEDTLSAHLELEIGGAAARYNSALDMTLKALLNIKILKEDLTNDMQAFQDHLKQQVPSALQKLFIAFVSGRIKAEGVYSCLLCDMLPSVEEILSMSSDAAQVVVAILEFWHCWKYPEKESLVTCLFTLVENESIDCRKCRRITNYQQQSSYGIVIAADSVRDLKCALGNINFVSILKVSRMEYQKSCDIITGGCGKEIFVNHFISRCPQIITIVLEWEKSETENDISETTKALEWEIDISSLYEGLVANTYYRLVSMVGVSEEEEHICLAYEKNRWVNLRRESFEGENVGNWKSVVKFCGKRKVRPEILFYHIV